MQQWRAHQHGVPPALTSKTKHVLTCIARTINSPRFLCPSIIYYKMTSVYVVNTDLMRILNYL